MLTSARLFPKYMITVRVIDYLGFLKFPFSLRKKKGINKLRKCFLSPSLFCDFVVSSILIFPNINHPPHCMNTELIPFNSTKSLQLQSVEFD